MSKKKPWIILHTDNVSWKQYFYIMHWIHKVVVEVDAEHIRYETFTPQLLNKSTLVMVRERYCLGLGHWFPTQGDVALI